MGYSHGMKTMEVLMIKKLMVISFLFNIFALLGSSDRCVSIPSDTDSDTEDAISFSAFKTMVDVEALRVLSPELLLIQAETLLNPISLAPIHIAPIVKCQDGSYVVGSKLFQDTKLLLQSDFDELSRLLETLASGRIFDDLFNVRFDSKQTVLSYVNWLKKSYKYAIVQVLSKKFQDAELQVLKKFEMFKDDQKAEVYQMMHDVQRQYPAVRSYCKHFVMPAGILAACSYGKRIVEDTSLKKYYNYIAVPAVLSTIGYNLLGLYTKHLEVKALDTTVTDLQAILRSIDHESLQINTQAYDRMIAKFMRSFDIRCDQFLQKEIKRLEPEMPVQEVRPLERAVVIRGKETTSSTLQKLTVLFKKIIH